MNTTGHTLVMHLIYIVLFLDDVREAINKIRRYVESESAFFNAFLEEGLRFSSSLYLCLIWIRILKHVFQKPDEAADHLINHPFFRDSLLGHLQRPILTDCANRYNPSVLVLLLDCLVTYAGSVRYWTRKQVTRKQQVTQVHHQSKNRERYGTVSQKKMISLPLHR